MSEDTSLPFPRSLPEFQRIFPDDQACAAYIERLRWREGFACPKCGERGEPFRDAQRIHSLTCRVCRAKTSLIAGTVMERTHSPLLHWFWGAYLVASEPMITAAELARRLVFSRYETAAEFRRRLLTVRLVNRRDRFNAALGFERPRRGPKPIDLATRFARHVQADGPIPRHRPELGPCAIWTGARDGRGYGKITVDAIVQLAPRVAFYLARGRWPEPCALHHCDNPPCVRDSHLFEGSRADNTADMIAKGRKAAVPSRLSADVLPTVVARSERGELQAAIARDYGVSVATISRALKRARHV